MGWVCVAHLSLGSVDVSFTAAFGPDLGLNKEKMATWYEHHERFLTFVQPQKGAKPEGLSRKMAIHCVMLLDNNPLLPSSHALCLAFFRLSAMANETSTGPSVYYQYVHLHIRLCNKTILSSFGSKKITRFNIFTMLLRFLAN